MANEQKDGKSRKVYKASAQVIAQVVGAKPVSVEKTRQGKRVTGPMAKKIALADEMYELGHNKLLDEIKRVVNF